MPYRRYAPLPNKPDSEFTNERVSKKQRKLDEQRRQKALKGKKNDDER